MLVPVRSWQYAHTSTSSKNPLELCSVLKLNGEMPSPGVAGMWSFRRPLWQCPWPWWHLTECSRVPFLLKGKSHLIIMSSSSSSSSECMTRFWEKLLHDNNIKEMWLVLGWEYWSYLKAKQSLKLHNNFVENCILENWQLRSKSKILKLRMVLKSVSTKWKCVITVHQSIFMQEATLLCTVMRQKCSHVCHFWPLSCFSLSLWDPRFQIQDLCVFVFLLLITGGIKIRGQKNPIFWYISEKSFTSIIPLMFYNDWKTPKPVSLFCVWIWITWIQLKAE